MSIQMAFHREALPTSRTFKVPLLAVPERMTGKVAFLREASTALVARVGSIIPAKGLTVDIISRTIAANLDLIISVKWNTGVYKGLLCQH